MRVAGRLHHRNLLFKLLLQCRRSPIRDAPIFARTRALAIVRLAAIHVLRAPTIKHPRCPKRRRMQIAHALMPQSPSTKCARTHEALAQKKFAKCVRAIACVFRAHRRLTSTGDDAAACCRRSLPPHIAAARCRGLLMAAAAAAAAAMRGRAHISARVVIDEEARSCDAQKPS